MTRRRLKRAPLSLAVGVGALLAMLALGLIEPPPASRAQELPPPHKVEDLPPPREGEAERGKQKDGKTEPGPPPLPITFGAPLAEAVGVTLRDVLRLALLNNLDIVQAQLAIQRARVNLMRARIQILPNFNLGSTYVHHEGQIQNTAGNVQTVDRDSLFVGGGPSLSIPFSNLVFFPPEARRLLAGASAAQMRVINDTLLAVADAYFAVLRVRRHLAQLDDTIEMYASEKSREMRANSPGLLPLMKAFVQTGFAALNDQARVETDLVRFQELRLTALQDLRTTSAELVRLLNLPQNLFLLPTEDFRYPLDLPGGDWLRLPLDELVFHALNNRPELAENRALVAAAMVRLRQAQWRPLIPTAVVNYNWGGFGGGPKVVARSASGAITLGHSGYISNFDTRTDFDATLVWRLDNLGLGNLAEIRDRRIQRDQAAVQLTQFQNQVMSQVVRAHEAVERGRERVRVMQAGLFDDKGRPDGIAYQSVRLNFRRIKGGEARPLEVVDAVRRLNDALDVYSTAMTDYDRARFRLLIALGLPGPALVDPQSLPAAPPRPAECGPAPLPASPTPPGAAPARGPADRPVALPAAPPPAPAPPGAAPAPRPAGRPATLPAAPPPAPALTAPALTAPAAPPVAPPPPTPVVLPPSLDAAAPRPSSAGWTGARGTGS